MEPFFNKFKPIIEGNINRGKTIGKSDTEQVRIQIKELYDDNSSNDSNLAQLEQRVEELETSGTGGSSTVLSTNSITGDGTLGNELQLSNDSSSPGNSKYYGTDSGGTKGFFSLPTASTVTVQEVDGSPSVVVGTIEFPNGTVTNPSSGVARYTPSSPTIVVTEVDGSPSVTATQIEFPNGTVTNPSGTIARYTPVAVNFARSSTNFTTGSLLNNASSTGTVTMGKSGYVLKITTDYPARIRLYVDSSSRSADSSRPSSTPPLQGIGLITEVVTTSTDLVIELTPSRIFWNNDSPVTSTIYWAATNLDSVTRDITTTLSYLVLE